MSNEAFLSTPGGRCHGEGGGGRRGVVGWHGDEPVTLHLVGGIWRERGVKCGCGGHTVSLIRGHLNEVVYVEQ